MRGLTWAGTRTSQWGAAARPPACGPASPRAAGLGQARPPAHGRHPAAPARVGRSRHGQFLSGIRDCFIAGASSLISAGGLDMRAELQAGDPRQVGPYRLLGRLGVGGMGRVYLGRSGGGPPVAVKVIRTDLADHAHFRVRFRREVAAARKVSGPFAATVVDADVAGPLPWLATAYVAGPSLTEAVYDHGPLPVASVLALAAGLAAGLGAIHAAGVMHRDLKPSNVLLARDGPRMIDFGISRAVEAASLTRSDTVMGSPGFMSPEQAEGREVGPASDVFSLGAGLTFAATGDCPFGTGPAAALVYRVVHNRPDIGQLPEQLWPLIGRCLAKDPRRRPTADQVLVGLGATHPAAGWLPAPVGQALAEYEVPVLAPGAADA